MRQQAAGPGLHRYQRGFAMVSACPSTKRAVRQGRASPWHAGQAKLKLVAQRAVVMRAAFFVTRLDSLVEEFTIGFQSATFFQPGTARDLRSLSPNAMMAQS
jgi:hypothetical protein